MKLSRGSILFVCRHVHVCRGMRRTPGAFHQLLPTFIFWNMVSPWTWSSLIPLGWAASERHRSTPLGSELRLSCFPIYSHFPSPCRSYIIFRMLSLILLLKYGLRVSPYRSCVRSPGVGIWRSGSTSTGRSSWDVVLGNRSWCFHRISELVL